MIIVIRFFPDQDVPFWHKAGDGGSGYSWAGWWHALVSAPVGLVLLLGWLWRILMWGFFLFRVSRLDLQLVPTHPDLVGGLQFVGESLRAFLLVSFTISDCRRRRGPPRSKYGHFFFRVQVCHRCSGSRYSAVVRRACRGLRWQAH